MWQSSSRTPTSQWVHVLWSRFQIFRRVLAHISGGCLLFGIETEQWCYSADKRATDYNPNLDPCGFTELRVSQCRLSLRRSKLKVAAQFCGIVNHNRHRLRPSPARFLGPPRFGYLALYRLARRKLVAFFRHRLPSKREPFCAGSWTGISRSTSKPRPIRPHSWQHVARNGLLLPGVVTSGSSCRCCHVLKEHVPNR